MTLHPHHLHAFTALLALARSWPMARAEAGRVNLAASDGIRSTVYGRTASGGHSDGGILAAVEHGVDEHHRWRRLLERIAQDVRDALWLARACTTLRPARGPLGILARAIPNTTPAYARDISRALADADHAARDALQLAPDRMPLPGVRCPQCGRRLLQACTTSPNRAAWTVICSSCSAIWRWTWIAAWDAAQRAAAAAAASSTSTPAAA